MSANSVTEDAVDPSGLGGQRYVHNARQLPYLIEVYGYPSHITLEQIKRAWLAVLPLGSSAGFAEEGVRGGQRLVKIDRFVREIPRPHIEEPNV